MKFRVVATVIGVTFFAHPTLAQDPQSQPAKIQDQVQADGSAHPPSFRRGLWRFKRTLDVVRNSNKNIKYRIADQEMTRCVDPTHAMKATFSAGSVGKCVSGKAEKVGNQYIFAHRCDYLGAVSTVITVHSDESYTEVNELSAGDNPKTDLVRATRVGDCQDDKADGSSPSTVSSLQH